MGQVWFFGSTLVGLGIGFWVIFDGFWEVFGRFVGISGRSGRDLAGAFGPVWLPGLRSTDQVPDGVLGRILGLGWSELGPQGRLGRGSFK